MFLANGSDTCNETKPIGSSPFKNGLKFVYKTLFPSIFQNKKERLIQNKVAKAVENISNKEFDLLVEFNEYGSDLCSEIKNKSSRPTLLVFDAPLVDKYSTFNSPGDSFKKWLREKERLSVENASHIFCYSNPVKDYLKKNYKISNPITVFPCISSNTINNPVSLKKSNEVRIGFVGSFLKWHKVDLLVNAFEVLAAKYENIYLDLIGNGMEWENIKKKVSLSKYRTRIDLPGFSFGEELATYKQKLHIGVMPGSNWFGSPIKIFEYANLKLPVVAASEPTILDLFKKDEEILFIDKQDELNSLVKHLEELILSEEKRATLGESIYLKHKESYSKKEYFRVLNEIVKKYI